MSTHAANDRGPCLDHHPYPASTGHSVSAMDANAPTTAPSLYLTLLGWAFIICSSTRLLTYLPTLWVIHQTGDSNPYSLWTWCAWVASNATMAAWLYETNQRRLNRAIVVTAGNAVMCVATCVFIVCHR